MENLCVDEHEPFVSRPDEDGVRFQASELPPPVKKRPVVSLMLDHYYQDLHLGVVRAACELGWDLDDTQCRHTHYRPYPSSEEPDGAIATATTEAGRKWLSACRCPKVRLLAGVGELTAGAARELQAVELDFFKAGEMGAKHLLSLGYQHLAYFHSIDGEDCRDLLEGFSFACRRAGRGFHKWDFPHEHPQWGSTTEGVPRAYWLEWIRQKIVELPLPCAIMTQDDRDAVQIVCLATELGLRVPEDLAVLGCEDLEVVHGKSMVGLSTIDMNMELAGYVAAKLLDRAMRGVAVESQRVLIPPRRLVERESTSAFVCEVPAVTKTVMRIRRDYPERLTVPGLAREAGMSVRTLQRLYGGVTGRSISEDLLCRRLEAAANLLRETPLKLESVAREVGLTNANYLCRLFKERYGVTPNQWRHKQEG